MKSGRRLKGASVPAVDGQLLIGNELGRWCGVIGLITLTTCGCSLLAANCLSRQKRGDVTTISGRVEAGETVMELAPYDQQGTQNDLHITWDGRGTAGGAQIQVYATGLSCTDFVPAPTDKPRPRTDPCAEIGRRVFTSTLNGEYLQGGLVVAGGPRQRGPDLHEYKLFVAGDPDQATDYTITITWFSGPDC